MIDFAEEFRKLNRRILEVEALLSEGVFLYGQVPSAQLLEKQLEQMKKDRAKWQENLLGMGKSF